MRKTYVAILCKFKDIFRPVLHARGTNVQEYGSVRLVDYVGRNLLMLKRFVLCLQIHRVAAKVG